MRDRNEKVPNFMSVFPQTGHHSDHHPPKIMANSTLTRVSSIHGSCLKAATLPKHNPRTTCQMFLKLFSATIVLNPNTVLFDEKRSSSNNNPELLPLGPTSIMADWTLSCQLEETQILVLHVQCSGHMSTLNNRKRRVDLA